MMTMMALVEDDARVDKDEKVNKASDVVGTSICTQDLQQVY